LVHTDQSTINVTNNVAKGIDGAGFWMRGYDCSVDGAKDIFI